MDRPAAPGAPPSRHAADRGDFEVRFVADCMLGTLAKWLILLGHDVAYFRRIEDGDLIEVARRERRTILTMDRHLVRRKAARDHILVHGQALTEQIRQVLRERRLRIRRAALFRRCVRCNRRTLPVRRAAVRTEVPPYVWRTQTRFTRCPGCRRIYWRATHVDRMVATLREDLQRRDR
jgi:hypothetical protein